jgi:hypothetical protein
MKIAIIGKGTSAIISALVCIDNGFDIEIFYDPDRPHISIGESTTPHIAKIVKKIFNHLTLDTLIDKNVVSLKKGIRFIDWGVGSNFVHSFEDDNNSFHFESSKFNPIINFELEKIGVKYHAEKVENYKIENKKIIINEKSYDFAINCTGWNSDPDYLYPFLETVNSAAIYIENFVDEEIGNYTIHTATEDGWEFGLPFPTDNITKHGYLFNNKYISIEEVKKKLNKDNIKTISWTPRYARKLITNPYIAFNGNSLFFAEPLQALSLLYYYTFAKLLCEFIKDKSYFSMNKVNHDYTSEVATYFYSLAYHYQFGSIHKDSIFWNTVTEKSKNIINFLPQLEKENLTDFIIAADKTKQENFAKIGVFEPCDLKTLQCGFLNKSFEEIALDRTNFNNRFIY